MIPPCGGHAEQPATTRQAACVYHAATLRPDIPARSARPAGRAVDVSRSTESTTVAAFAGHRTVPRGTRTRPVYGLERGAQRLKLIMTLLVRNEADILAANIEYHLNRGVDFIIATDNLSDDGTRGILEHYRQMNVLHPIVETDDDYAQHKWVTRMARLACSDFGADWVINNDADEFWWPDETDSLKDALRTLPPSVHAASAQRCNFTPVRATGRRFFADVMTLREVHSVNAAGNPLPPKVCHRASATIEIEQGNHAVREQDQRLQATPAPITILHFPLRSYSQFAGKIALGGAAYARNAYLDKRIGHTWRMLYEKWQRGELEDYYRGQELDEADAAAGLASGRLVRDERLKDFFAGLEIDERPA